MIVLTIVRKGSTRVNWRIVMLKTFIMIGRNPSDIEKYITFKEITQSIKIFTYKELE